jgi:hypothetical protein
MSTIDGGAFAHAAHLLYALSLALRADLRKVHAELVASVKAAPGWSDPDILLGTIGLVGHSAYHLGAMRTIRQHLARSGQ